MIGAPRRSGGELGEPSRSSARENKAPHGRFGTTGQSARAHAGKSCALEKDRGKGGEK
mgnify:CR=1 FL=1